MKVLTADDSKIEQKNWVYLIVLVVLKVKRRVQYEKTFSNYLFNLLTHSI